jgi:predicted nucleotidyltransferase
MIPATADSADSAAAIRAAAELQATGSHMEKALTTLVEKLQKAYGDKLVSVVLYGSAAAGDYNGKFSDLNILCALTELTPKELGASEEIFRWWR